MEYFIILVVMLIAVIFAEWKFHLHLYHSIKERIIITLHIFLLGMIWDYYATYNQHWIFPGPGLVGIRIFNLPIEEFMFFLIVPYAVLTTYKYLDKRIK
jgi:lycopene cyclase domain-containing protein